MVRKKGEGGEREKEKRRRNTLVLKFSETKLEMIEVLPTPAEE
jgi:hypothetical protein